MLLQARLLSGKQEMRGKWERDLLLWDRQAKRPVIKTGLLLYAIFLCLFIYFIAYSHFLPQLGQNLASEAILAPHSPQYLAGAVALAAATLALCATFWALSAIFCHFIAFCKIGNKLSVLIIHKQTGKCRNCRYARRPRTAPECQ